MLPLPSSCGLTGAFAAGNELRVRLGESSCHNAYIGGNSRLKTSVSAFAGPVVLNTKLDVKRLSVVSKNVLSEGRHNLTRVMCEFEYRTFTKEFRWAGR